MAAATQELDTPERKGQHVSLPVEASTTIYAGALVAINASGNAVPASDSANLKVVGRAEETVANSGSAGDKSITAKRGTFRFDNSATNAVAAANRFSACYVEDDHTVGTNGGTNNVKAGLVVDVDEDGVWVDTTRAQS